MDGAYKLSKIQSGQILECPTQREKVSISYKAKEKDALPKVDIEVIEKVMVTPLSSSGFGTTGGGGGDKEKARLGICQLLSSLVVSEQLVLSRLAGCE